MAQNGNLHGREKNSLKVEKLFLEGCISKEKKVGSNGDRKRKKKEKSDERLNEISGKL